MAIPLFMKRLSEWRNHSRYATLLMAKETLVCRRHRAAAMRYTEIRMTKMAHALLEDLEKDTVEFKPNYDETESIPQTLPTKVPNLLVNGSSGIAVGMATNIPPHNLKEIIEGCLALIENKIEIDELMQIPGPDFNRCDYQW